MGLQVHNSKFNIYLNLGDFLLNFPQIFRQDVCEQAKHFCVFSWQNTFTLCKKSDSVLGKNLI